MGQKKSAVKALQEVIVIIYLHKKQSLAQLILF